MTDIPEIIENPIVMVTDDDEDFLYIIEALIKKRNKHIDVRSVADGAELMDYLLMRGQFKNRDREQKPDLILLDANMPRKSGIEVLEEIKDNPNLNQIPIVVVSAVTEDEVAHQVLELGAKSFIQKDQLNKEIDKLVDLLIDYWINVVKDNDISKLSTKDYDPIDIETKEHLIWIVDDDQVYQKIIKKSINKIRPNIKLKSFNTGEEFLNELESNCDSDDFEIPDLVLLDYYMPEKNGLEVLKELREFDQHRVIPVVLFSGMGNEEISKQAVDLGARSYIAKPTNINDVLDLLKTLTNYWVGLAKVPSK